MRFSFNLPLHFKKRSGTAKYLMKNFWKDICQKNWFIDKVGFPAPIGNWLTGDLSYLIDQWLSKKRIQQQGIFNEKMIQEYVSAFRKGDRFHDKRIWALVFFQMWYEEYVA
jgi:asparagine synthase (glutamine-hydrolysing)